MKIPKECDKSMTFNDCELAILRSSVDLAQENIGKRNLNSPEIQEIIDIVETFLKRKNLICYGGTAINNILPKDEHFYNRDVEIPDYDFFSPNSLEDAKELANIYFEKGYDEVEAKSGQHKGTFKVFVNFIPIADITYLPKELYDNLKKESIRVGGILYAAPNYLRMSMYLELSRPAGDTDRWEKVLKRLTLLNKHYPLTSNQCSTIDFQRQFADDEKGNEIYENVKDTFINQSVVFFGGYAISIYSKYMQKSMQKKIENIPDFDVLSIEPETTAEIVKERLKEIHITNVKIIKHEQIGDVIPIHYEIRVGKDTIAFIYKPPGCHSYNNIYINGRTIKIATIDTMLSFYLAFLYADRGYYDNDRILCMATFLFDVQQKNRLEQKGVLKRFTITCYGHQDSLEEIRAEKSRKFKELINKKGTKEYEMSFLSYKPSVLRSLHKRNIKLNKKNKKIKKLNKTQKKTSLFFDPYNSKTKTMKQRNNKTKKI